MKTVMDEMVEHNARVSKQGTRVLGAFLSIVGVATLVAMWADWRIAVTIGILCLAPLMVYMGRMISMNLKTSASLMAKMYDEQSTKMSDRYSATAFGSSFFKRGPDHLR
jgi:hypothetical protein